MFELLMSEGLSRYPALHLITTLLVAVIGGFMWWKGTRTKHEGGHDDGHDNRSVTTLDFVRFQSELNEDFADKRKDMYARYDALETRVRSIEIDLAVLKVKRVR